MSLSHAKSEYKSQDIHLTAGTTTAEVRVVS